MKLTPGNEKALLAIAAGHEPHSNSVRGLLQRGLAKYNKAHNTWVLEPSGTTALRLIFARMIKSGFPLEELGKFYIVFPDTSWFPDLPKPPSEML